MDDMRMESVCEACRHGWVHCHASLVLHADGEAECGEIGCSGASDLHELVIACEDLEPPCGCVSEGVQATPHPD